MVFSAPSPRAVAPSGKSERRGTRGAKTEIIRAVVERTLRPLRADGNTGCYFRAFCGVRLDARQGRMA
jgi:hypothetical protein